MSSQDKVYDSIQPEPDDDVWLAQGRKMIKDSFTAIHDAAKSLLICLGFVQGAYIGVLGFGEFSKTMSTKQALLFMVPVLFWLPCVFFCMRVLQTKRRDIYLHSPTDIRYQYEAILENKQHLLNWAFVLFSLSLLTIFFLLVMYR